MFNLIIDKEISLRTLHPDDADDLFKVLEQNRAHLRPWIDPSALPQTAKAARRYTIECFFNSLHDPMEAMIHYDDYFQELEHYFPGPNPPMEMGIWGKGQLVGAITLSRLTDSYTAAEFGYWLAAAKERKGIVTRCI